MTDNVDHVTVQDRITDPKKMGTFAKHFPTTGGVIIDVHRQSDMLALDVDEDGSFMLIRFKDGFSEVLFKSKDHTFQH